MSALSGDTRSRGSPIGPAAAALIATGIVLRLFLLWRADGTMIDDAYITLRYAENLLSQGALVYNAGHHVLGVTCPLYAAWLSLLMTFTSPHLIAQVAGVSNIVFFAAAALLLARLTSSVGRLSSLLVLAGFALHLRFVDSSVNGMETSLFVLGVVGSVWLLRAGRHAWLSLLVGLMLLVRPEAAFLGLALLAAAVRRGTRPRPRDLAPGALVVASWVAWSWAYYGSPVPQSVISKCGWLVPYSNLNIVGRFLELFGSLSLIEAPAGLSEGGPVRAALATVAVVSLALFVTGVRYLWRRRSALLTFPLLFLLYLLVYLAAKGRPDFSWYGVPSGLAYLVTCVAGAAWAFRSCSRARSEARVRRICLTMVLPGVAALLTASAVVAWGATRLPYYRVIRNSYELAGTYVSRECPADAFVLVDELGMIGWRCDRRTYDLAGIVSPEVFQYCSSCGWKAQPCDVVRRFLPDVVVFSTDRARDLREGPSADWIAEHYRVAAVTERHTVLRRVV